MAINTLIVTPSGGGGRTYLSNLVRHIAEIDKRTSYYLFVSRRNESLFHEVGENFQRVLVPSPSRNRPFMVLWQQLLIPYYVGKHRVNVLLSYGNIATLFPRCRQVVIVDGAQTLRRTRLRYAPDSVSRARSIYFDIMSPLSLRRASRVITVSQFMKKELVKSGRVPAHKVSVVYEGIDINEFSGKKTSVSQPNLPQPYILFLSDLYKHKNVDKLIRAFPILKASHNIPHNLVIVGRDNNNISRGMRELAHRLGVMESTIFTGPVEYESVPDIYRNADVFVYPSGLESFGLPVLEAMACSTPVVGSNRTAIPEVVGDAGITVDVDDAEALADAIYQVLADQSLRSALVQKGRERALTFTWERAARDTIRVLDEVCGS